MLQHVSTKSSTIRNVLKVVAIVSLGGCTDVQYDYDIPEGNAECPAGMSFRSGGGGIVDRSGGSGIVDRNGGSVDKYCYIPTCANPDFAVAAEMDWHQDSHQVVVAEPHCPEVSIPEPPCPCDGDAEDGDTEGGDAEEDTR